MISPAQADIPLGAVVHDERGDPWVFVCYTESTKSTGFLFYRAKTIPSSVEPWHYNCVSKQALISKFPDAQKYLSEIVK